MLKRPSVAAILKKVLVEDPRLAIAFVETLGPTPSEIGTTETDES